MSIYTLRSLRCEYAENVDDIQLYSWSLLARCWCEYTENVRIKTNNIMENIGLNQKANGKPMMQYMADLLESNEQKDIEIERGKLSVAILKQMNNYSRLKLDAAKFMLKSAEARKENMVQNADTRTNIG